MDVPPASHPGSSPQPGSTTQAESPPPASEAYSPEAVQQILQLAFAKQEGAEAFSRSQLQEMAQELGIKADDLQWAESQWQQAQSLSTERQAFAQEQRQRWTQNGVKFAIINGFLLTLDWFTSSDQHLHWSLVILLLWGMGFSLKTWQTFQRGGEAYDRRFQNWRRRRQLKRSVKSLVSQALDRVGDSLKVP